MSTARIAQLLNALRCARKASSSLITLASLLLVSALVARLFASPWARLAAAATVSVLAPLLLRASLARAVRERTGCAWLPGVGWTLAGWNALVLVVLCLGFSASTGRALRRRGDWFLGERDGVLAQLCRQAITRAGRWMERFDAPEMPPPAREILADALQPPALPFEPAELTNPPRPPEQPGDPPPPLVPAVARWYHPTGGPRRLLPPNAICRFGAPRPGRRPRECDLGHCGVDLAARVGTPVYAVHDGIVLKAERDALRGGRAGRYVKLAHKDGSVKTYYVHLDTVRRDLSPGDPVRGGERIGTIGLTGVKRSGPHLHFGLAVRWPSARRHHYIDPEPLLWHWNLPAPRPSPGGADRSKYLASCASCCSSPEGCAPASSGRSAASSWSSRATAHRSTCAGRSCTTAASSKTSPAAARCSSKSWPRSPPAPG